MKMISLFSGQPTKGLLDAIDKSMAMIEFDLSGKILHANENFLAAIGYELNEIVGKHHRIFVDPKFAGSDDYAAFWSKLGRGEYDSGRYKRIGKGGREIWLEASYNPILHNGKPVKVVKFATDITENIRRSTDSRGKIEALSRSQAVIEFETDGTIITANENFETDMTSVFYENKAWVEQMISNIPAGRLGELSDLSGTVKFLASSASRYIIGQCVIIDGGYLAKI